MSIDLWEMMPTWGLRKTGRLKLLGRWVRPLLLRGMPLANLQWRYATAIPAQKANINNVDDGSLAREEGVNINLAEAEEVEA
ncbi:uncharacterized protein A4U43_C08F14940 [Asparagus officinalis]|nr:uncharacterized protein A4U43_C08F14940 [Asparagus officinalis]